MDKTGQIGSKGVLRGLKGSNSGQNGSKGVKKGQKGSSRGLMVSKGLKRALTRVSWHVLARRRKIEENEEGEKKH